MPNTIRLFHFTNDRWGAENVKKRRLKLSFPNLVNDVFELRPFDFGKGEQARILRGAWSQAIEKHSMTQGFISFSKSWVVPTMWGHYADNHKGVCLGFDLPIRRDDGVEYADKIDYIDNLRAIDKRILTDVAYNEKMTKIARKTKSSHWSYEEEWRCWFSLSDEEKKLKQAKPDERIFVKFGPNLVLREVIFGVNSTHTTESFKALLHTEDNVEFTTARPSFRRFAMVPQRNPSLVK
ncbi:DUF2971 domain-containing protein [Aliiroseovarius crassostreae]|uniref:DUF2971 domain-containing protein n=1 Tax=Aliiroseovarius crassostreae TaxID=154981 RepID=UPI00220A4FD6|nr:DUF2971 domain-containing protein [Aliiroseovarius crassostreae]UWP98148.1 DUF2971 domain-containing protein [Aliiroseovarius crassostreae]